jgi:hypothetical protein
LPLDKLFVVTTAVKLPADARVEKVTVSDVAVAAVTVPTAPLLNTTLLFPAVVLKPNPLMTNVLAVRESVVVRSVTVGITVATCTAEPLFTLFVVTIAVKLPAEVGFVVNEMVSDVAVAEVTVPTAPLLNATVLLAAVVLKPVPVKVMVVRLAARFAVLEVTTGITVAT